MRRQRDHLSGCRAATGRTGSIQEWLDAAGALVAKVDADGSAVFTPAWTDDTKPILSLGKYVRITENHLHPYGGFVIGDAGGTEAQRSTFWGIGNRMKPGAAAFAAGYSAGSTTGGGQFVAIGQNATGESRFISIGCSATAGTNYSTALGYQSKALAGGAMAIGGYKAEASGVSAIAVGMFSLASGVSSVAVAGRASAVGENAIAVGTYAFCGHFCGRGGSNGAGDGFLCRDWAVFRRGTRRSAVLAQLKPFLLTATITSAPDRSPSMGTVFARPLFTPSRPAT